MKLLRTILSVLRARWFWSLVGAVLLSLVIWFFGDLIGVGDNHPLAPEMTRLLVVLGIAILWGLWNVLSMARSRRRNEKLVSALTEPARERTSANPELAELNKRFAGALEDLKHSRLGKKGNRRWLYELPWYVMVGPPGSGKSTALAQSGLRLRLGQVQELRGTAGTRYCDWIFTDEAILIDTAGRYTTQDSDAAADKAAWLGFLDMLKEKRSRFPLNGILVALSIRDLLQSGGSDHASAIRARLDEIENRLGMRLPVYLLLTKADLIAGFEPFFDSLNETEREQVWGYTFDYTQQPRRGEAIFDASVLQEAWTDLVARLDHLVPSRLAAEPDISRRAQIFGFPAQVAALGDEVVRFVQRCFQPSSYERGGFLRGIYLTSGTQTGTPIDRLLAAIGQSIGARIAPVASVSGDRSFFLRRPLEGVIFPEADIADRDIIRDRRQGYFRAATIAGIATLAILFVSGWAWSFFGNGDRYAAVEKDLSAWSQDARAVSQARPTGTDADALVIMPLLDRLANMRASLRREDSIDLHLGLSQASTLDSQLDSAYRTALVRMLLPRLFLVTERNLRARLKESDYLAIGLKVYLSLAGTAPVDPDLLQRWFGLTLQPGSNDMSASIGRHVSALVAILPEIDAKARPTPDPPLLAEAQVSFARVPLAKRAYTALVSSSAVAALPGWKLTEHAGPNASIALVRRSGRPLDYPIPAVLTYDGFYQVFLPQLDSVARGSFAEYWVLTGHSTPEVSDADIRKLKNDMLRLYYDDVIAAWDGLLRDITIVPINTLDQAVAATKALSGPSSPLKLLILAVVKETSLTVQPDPTQADPKNPAAIAMKAAAKVNGSLDKLAQLIRLTADAAPTEVPGAPVEARFAYLRRLVQGENGAPPALDDALTALGALNAKLTEATASPNAGEAFARMGNSATTQLALAAQQLPDPLRQMLDGVQRKATDMSRTGVRQQINAVWTTDVLPFCQTAIADRFPFSPSSPADATIDDVTRVFGPNGLIETFIKTQLANLVDMTRRPWRDNQNLGLSTTSLEALARAHRITMALFPSGAGPKAAFSVVPLSLDNDSASADLKVDEQALRYAHGPPQPVAFTWPGPAGVSTVRLTFVPFGGGAPVTTTTEGPWALFRLLHQKNFQPTPQPDVFEADVGAGSHSMRLRLRANSVENPFDLRLLSGFTCPEGL